jgi:hypothetical protein
VLPLPPRLLPGSGQRLRGGAKLWPVVLPSPLGDLA